MSARALSLYEMTTCAFCLRSRHDVPALVRLGSTCICSECVADAAEALMNHYAPLNPFAGVVSPIAPVPA